MSESSDPKYTLTQMMALDFIVYILTLPEFTHISWKLVEKHRQVKIVVF
jgi:hypothetical protein